MRQNASWGPQTVRPIYSISRIGRHGLMSFEAHLGRDKKLSVSAFKAVARAHRAAQCRGACAEHQGEEPPDRGRCGSTCRGVRSFRRLRGRLIGALVCSGLMPACWAMMVAARSRACAASRSLPVTGPAPGSSNPAVRASATADLLRGNACGIRNFRNAPGTSCHIVEDEAPRHGA